MPSSEADCSSATSPKRSRILWKPNVNYPVHNTLEISTINENIQTLSVPSVLPFSFILPPHFLLLFTNSVVYFIRWNKINRGNGLLVSLRRCVLERPTPLPSLKLKYYLLYSYTSVTLSHKTIPSFVSLSSFSNFKPRRRTYFNTSRQRRRQVFGLEFSGVTLAARLIVLDGVETVRELHTLVHVLIEFLMKWRSPSIQFLLHANE
jgi:hypothetical protein